MPYSCFWCYLQAFRPRSITTSPGWTIGKMSSVKQVFPGSLRGPRIYRSSENINMPLCLPVFIFPPQWRSLALAAREGRIICQISGRWRPWEAYIWIGSWFSFYLPSAMIVYIWDSGYTHRHSICRPIVLAIFLFYFKNYVYFLLALTNSFLQVESTELRGPTDDKSIFLYLPWLKYLKLIHIGPLFSPYLLTLL